ncbi:MAG: DNA mismatch repair endonuclease MutL, partial [Deltaproteobacteria bacterium]|nr:DNA mismatch repair endonuclease MutL [Deltaproteobacteria bacterium]
MSKIKILPEVLSNKIAAGEVVERPASVVKELVENALDAGSSRIIIEIEKGGRSLIRVSDNGSGMNRDDALLAIERYATSKIFKDRDLFAISTLGFRGEALPSIASVSRFTLVTKDESSAVGTEIVVQGGTVKKVSDVGAPTGTMVTVGQLFFNTPARRKFLKTVNTEMGHIADAVAAFALGRPRVQFRLVHNGKVLKSWPTASDPVDRVVDVLGKSIENDLHSLKFDDNAVTVTGWTASPRVARSTSRGIYIFVNGRLVRDRVIRHALFEGYGKRLMKGQFPMAVIFIKVPYDQVDVNVHPAKHEVRFAQQKRVHDAVAGAVAETLRYGDRSAWITTPSTPRPPAVEQHRIAEQEAVFGRDEKRALRLRSTAFEDGGALCLRSAAFEDRGELGFREKEDAAAEQTPL